MDSDDIWKWRLWFGEKGKELFSVSECKDTALLHTVDSLTLQWNCVSNRAGRLNFSVFPWAEAVNNESTAAGETHLRNSINQNTCGSGNGFPKSCQGRSQEKLYLACGPSVNWGQTSGKKREEQQSFFWSKPIHCQGHCRAEASLQLLFHQKLKTTFHQPTDPSIRLSCTVHPAHRPYTHWCNLTVSSSSPGFSIGGLYYQIDGYHWDQTEISKHDNDKTEKSRNWSNVFLIRAYRAIIQNACVPPCLCTENSQGPQPKDPFCKGGSFSIFTKKVPLSASKGTKHIIKIQLLVCTKTFLLLSSIPFLLCSYFATDLTEGAWAMLLLHWQW